MWAKLRNTDPDDLFAYDTFKIVTIRDRRLGLIHYALMIVIFVYIVIYNIIYQQGFIKSEDPVGSVRTTLKRPDTFGPPDDYPYCYSASNPTGTLCYYGDQYDVLYPPMEESAMFLTTRVTRSTWVTKPQCIQQQILPECADRGEPSNSTFFYYADVENFTILIEHTVRGDQIDVTATNTHMKGKLVDSTGHTVVDYSNMSRTADIMSLGQLLKASGIKLEQLDESPLAKKGETLRSSGTVIIVFIEYSNELSDPKVLTYKYIPRYIVGAEFKVEVPFYEPNGNLLVDNRHGVRLVFIQNGSIGAFNFLTLLLNLVSGLVLVKVATTIVDVVAMRLLPQRALYKKYKFERTEDFSDIREGKVQIDEDTALISKK